MSYLDQPDEGDAARFMRAIGDAPDIMARLCAVSFYSKRGWETRIWPCRLATCGPVNVDANGAPV